MINLKKIALVVLSALVINQINADTFLGKLINNHPYLTALGCVAMGGTSLLVGIEAKKAQNWQDEYLDKGKLRFKNELESKNFAQLGKIIYHHKLYPTEITTQNMGLDEKERAYLAAIEYGSTIGRESYCIQKSITYRHYFPADQRFVKYVVHEHDVRYWELPPIWQKKVQDGKEKMILKPIKRYELEIKKQNRWIPAFCFGVSALNFASAIGFAAYSFSKKA
ncbi:MAG: hypothetical protein BWY54_00079 [Candidatus Dependentiae bacterium ADurb.Bin331]|nr:MAG: hypothetical protein BWY54_00079 [Candidatus Dependentiae bacterium ADurb.Bin331]